MHVFKRGKKKNVLLNTSVKTYEDFTTLSLKTIYDRLNTSDQKGLSLRESKLRLEQYGQNTVKAKTQTFLHILWRQFTSPFIYLLLFAAGLSFFLHAIVDALFILFFVFLNAIIMFSQEWKSHQAVLTLTKLLSSYAFVLRDGQWRQVEKEKLVVGDIVRVKTGDRIPADIRFIETEGLLIDESILSGETTPVMKSSKSMRKTASSLFKAYNIGFSGTTVAHGSGKGIVIAVGKQTVSGDIAMRVSGTNSLGSFQEQLSVFSQFMIWMVVFSMALLILINIFLKGPQLDFIELFIFAIALSVSVVPEALPVVLSFSLARGALLLARKKVIVKRLSAIEDLGGIEVLCTDKTGTITENNLKAVSFYGNQQDMVKTAALFFALRPKEKVENPFDKAILSFLTNQAKKSIESSYVLEKTYPFDPHIRQDAILVKEGKTSFLYVRGAPEAVLKQCDVSNTQDLMAWVKAEGMQGRRVLAFAKIPWQNHQEIQLHTLQHRAFIGMISYHDPLKLTTKHTIKKANELNVRLKMLTGDHPDVAGAIASQVGLIENPSHVITGEVFDAMPIHEQIEAVETYHVFARMTPQQKLGVMHLLRQKYTVGFLGDGINDAPALKIAHVGLVVKNASDVARDAADIILTQKDLKSIIEGIRIGRQIFANTMKYMLITVSGNFGNFYAIAIASFFVPFLPILPVQILLLNLLTDFPLIAVSSDRVDDEEVSHPRKYQVRHFAYVTTYFGIISTVFDFITFVVFAKFGAVVLQTMWFIQSVLAELVSIYALRTKRPFWKGLKPSKTLLVISIIALLLTFALPFTSFGMRVFHFIQPTFFYIYMVVAIIVGYFIATEIAKMIFYRYVAQASLHDQIKNKTQSIRQYFLKKSA